MRWAQSSSLFFVLFSWTLGCNARENTGPAALDAGAAKPMVTAAESLATTGSATMMESSTSAVTATTTTTATMMAASGGNNAMDAGVTKPPVVVDASTREADKADKADAATAQPGAAALDPEISAVVQAVDPMRVGMSIEKLSSFTTRNTCSDGTAGGNAIGAARDWIQSQLQAVPGFTVSLQNAPFRGCNGGMVTVQNVVAVKLGAHPERVFAIGGHYDSRSTNGTDPTSVSPGANDSGSQTSALLEIARALGPLQLDATVLIAAFTGEEQGLIGSGQLAKDYATFVVPNAKIEAMFNMDIVGGDNTVNDELTLQQFRLFSAGTPRESNRMGVTDDTSPARGVMRYIGHWGSKYVPSMTMLPNLREDRPGRGSDQSSFLDQGIPAVRFIEVLESENAGTTNSHQHSPNDLPKFVTPAYTARIVQIITAVTASLARAPMAPTIEGATGATMLTWKAPAAGPAVDHYVIAARPTTENLYHTRVVAPAMPTSMQLTAADLGLTSGSAFFISVASVDAAGHESLFAYPEYRCDSNNCQVQQGSLDVTTRN